MQQLLTRVSEARFVDLYIARNEGNKRERGDRKEVNRVSYLLAHSRIGRDLGEDAEVSRDQPPERKMDLTPGGVSYAHNSTRQHVPSPGRAEEMCFKVRMYPP